MELPDLVPIATELMEKARKQANDYLGDEVIGKPRFIHCEFGLDQQGRVCSAFSDSPVGKFSCDYPYNPGGKEGPIYPATAVVDKSKEEAKEEVKTTRKRK